jgi:hypothetical protein
MYGATSVADDFGACTVQHYKKLGGSDAGEGSELLHLTGTPLAFLLYFSHLQVSLAHLVPREGVYALRTQRLDFPTQVSSSWTLDDRLRVATVLPSRSRSHLCSLRPLPEPLSPKTCLRIHFTSPAVIVYVLLQVYLDFNVAYILIILISGWACVPLSHPCLLNWSCSPNGKIESLCSQGCPILVLSCIVYGADEFRLVIRANYGMQKGLSFSSSRRNEVHQVGQRLWPNKDEGKRAIRRGQSYHAFVHLL